MDSKIQKKLFLRYISVFALMTLVSGVSFGLFMLFKYDFYSSVIKAFKFGIIIGLFGTLFPILKDYISISKMPEEAFSLTQEAEIKADIAKLDKEDIVAKIVKLSNVKKVVLNNDEICAYTKFNADTYGEIITISARSVSDEMIINIKSRSRLKTMQLDYGRNYKNIQLVKSIIENILLK